MRHYIFAATILVGCPAIASEGPSFDCSKASGDVETTICSSADLGALDRKMATSYSQAEADAGPEKGIVEAGQKVWLSQRDSCASSSDITTCLTNAYNGRIAHLTARWNLETPFATATWECERGDLTTVFYTTETASLRAEYNGGTEVMLQAMSGSGARYTNDTMGSSFWEKGREASFTWKHGPSESCTQKS